MFKFLALESFRHLGDEYLDLHGLKSQRTVP